MTENNPEKNELEQKFVQRVKAAKERTEGIEDDADAIRALICKGVSKLEAMAIVRREKEPNKESE